MTEKSAINADTQRSEKEREDAHAPVGEWQKIKAEFADYGNAIGSEAKKLGNEFGDYRGAAIRALPNFIVNNSASVIGAMHMTAELAMFKSNGTANLVNPANQIDFTGWKNPAQWGEIASKSWRKLPHYLIDPPKNVWDSVSTRAKVGTSLGNFANPNFYLKSAGEILDWKGATIRDIDAAKGIRVGERLVNRWQARSTFAGIVGWGISLITPNAKETEAEVERRVRLAHENPVAYVGDSIARGVMFPIDTGFKLVDKVISLSQGKHEDMDIGEGKRQFAALGMLIAGVCSFLGGFRNVSKLGGEHYYFNWQYCATGAITFMSSLPLLFETDNDKGYSKFGAIHMARIGFLPGSIMKKFSKGDKGAEWYLLGHAGLQSENAFAAFVGGAQKRPDGTIVDHKGISEEVKKKAKEAKAQHKTHADEVPSATVQQVAEHVAPSREAAQAMS